MSVIIRLQNLPWAANALDIRKFFKGLSIPDGGVHIVGGEMGDAFIAFSTDEDARLAMRLDREAISGVQVRLLLSSRAEMQNVIENARQQSLLALRNAATPAVAIKPIVKQQPSSNLLQMKNSLGMVSTPQPPVITSNSLQNILSNPVTVTPSFLAYQQQAGIQLVPDPYVRKTMATSRDEQDEPTKSRRSHESNRSRGRRSDSREYRRSGSDSEDSLDERRRRDRSRSRDQERQRSRNHFRSSNRNRRRSRDRSQESSDHSRDRSRDRSPDRCFERRRINSRDPRERAQNSRSYSNRPRKVESPIEQMKANSYVSPWGIVAPMNSYQTNYTVNMQGNASAAAAAAPAAAASNEAITQPKSIQPLNIMGNNSPQASAAIGILPNFDNYAAKKSDALTASSAAGIINNYNVNSAALSNSNSSDSFKGFAFRNPYTTAANTKVSPTTKDTMSLQMQENITIAAAAAAATNSTTSSSAIPGIYLEKKPEEALNTQQSLTTELASNAPIAFANTNPYEQMYPKLFAKAAALSAGSASQKLPMQQASGAQSISMQDSVQDKDGLSAGGESPTRKSDFGDTCSVKVSNMCTTTTYSELRKFFTGLFIPHNGIKMLNDRHGIRVGVAYVQFSRQSSVPKALCRSNNMLKGQCIYIEAVSEEDFNNAEDSFRPSITRDKPNYDEIIDHPFKQESNRAKDTYTVLYVEDIPYLATEQDIMKMFSSYSLYDILLIASPENRREFVAHVRFSRADEAKAAYEDRAHHQIGYRKLKIRPGSVEEMEKTKEKIRLANEQLMKEEEEQQAAAMEKQVKPESTSRTENSAANNDEAADNNDDDHNNDDGDGEDDVMDLSQDDDEDEVIDTTEDLRNIEQENEDNYECPSNVDFDDEPPAVPHIPSLLDMNNDFCSNDIRENDNYENCNGGDGDYGDDDNDDNADDYDDDDGDGDDEHMHNDPRRRNIPRHLMNNMRDNSSELHLMNEFNSNFNNTEHNFIIIKNCDYNMRINDAAQLLLTANLALKHIEPLYNERNLSTGEFIVEFRRSADAVIAIENFHNIKFRNRSLRVFPITPQEIADRLNKPFLRYMPGGNGPRTTDSTAVRAKNKQNGGGMSNNYNNGRSSRNRNGKGKDAAANSSNDTDNFSSDTNTNNQSAAINSLPNKFMQPGCVLSLENVPYKASITDILHFFGDFDLSPDDVIRRFNDDGSPTGDARIAFESAEEARAAYDAKRRKQIFNRTIYMKIMQ